MYGLSLALGLLSVALVTRLASRSGAGRWAGVLAGLALAVYPTHYRNLAGAAAIAVALGLGLETADWTASAASVFVNLRWHGAAATGADATQFAHVFDFAGAFLGQTDGAALGGLYPLRLWGPEEVVSEQRRVALPSADPACLVVHVGWYDLASGRRWAAWDPAGQPYPDDAVPVAER